ncbi:uncharacterized protein LOC144864510 isoform X2 [Branchiostoma floridae x Branchiostoma japonicum]
MARGTAPVCCAAAIVVGWIAGHLFSVTATYCAYYDPDQRAHDYTYEDDMDHYGEPIAQDEVLADNKTMKCSQDKDICFALWEAALGGDEMKILKQGCWNHPGKEHTCGEPECFTRGPSPPSMNKTKFCCCKGNMCNNNVTDQYIPPVTHVPPYPTPAYAQHSTYKEETTIIVMTVVCSTAIIISAIYFLIRVWHGSQRELHHTMHLTDDISITPSLDMDNLKLLQVLGAEERIGMEGTVEYLLVMDYAHHGSLYHYLKTYMVNWTGMCRLGHSLARGLAHLHSDFVKAGESKPAVAHRDLTSRNILVKADGSCALSDLGFAMRLTGNRICNPGQEDTAHITEVGTVRYMAPEVLEGAVNLRDFESALKQVDMYAVGLILWEIATRCQDLYMGQPVPEYMQPFQAELGQHPTFEELQVIVSREKRRPQLSDAWRENSQAVKSLKETIEDCWDQDAEARLTALCVEERMAELMSMWSRNSTVSPTLNPTSTAGSSSVLTLSDRNTNTQQFRWSGLYENSSTEPLHRMGYLLDVSDGSTSRTEMMDVKDTNVHVNAYRARQETSVSSCSDPPFMSSSRYQRIASPSTVSTSLSTNASLLLEMESTNSLTPSTTTTTLSEHTNTNPEDLLGNYPDLISTTAANTTTLIEMSETLEKHTTDPKGPNTQSCRKNLNELPKKRSMDKYERNERARHSRNYNVNIHTSDESLSGSLDQMTCKAPPNMSVDRLTHEEDLLMKHMLAEAEINTLHPKQGTLPKHDNLPQRPTTLSIDSITARPETLVKVPIESNHVRGRGASALVQGGLGSHSSHNEPCRSWRKKAQAEQIEMGIAKLESNGHQPSKIKMSPPRPHVQDKPKQSHRVDAESGRDCHRVDAESDQESCSEVQNQTDPTDCNNILDKSIAPTHPAETIARSESSQGAMQRANSLIWHCKTSTATCPTHRPQRPTSLDLSCFQGQKEQPPPRAVSEMSGIDQVVSEGGERGGKDPSSKIKKRPKTPYSLPKRGLMSFSVFNPPKDKRASKSACKVNYVSGKTIVSVLNESKKTRNGTTIDEQRLTNGAILPAKHELYTKNGEIYSSPAESDRMFGSLSGRGHQLDILDNGSYIVDNETQQAFVVSCV